MEMSDFNVVIIGAGPGGIAAGLTLGDRFTGKVLIIEHGRGYRARICPVDRQLRCEGCKGKCNVISGFGGALHYGDATKFSLFPSGRRLIELFGSSRASALCDDAARLLETLTARPFKSHAPEERISAHEAFSREGLYIRDYPVVLMAEAEVEALLQRAYSRLQGAHTLALREKLLDISYRGGMFTVITSRRRVRAKNVIMATGRSGVTLTQRTLRQFNIPMTPPKPSIGVRFELPSAVLQPIGRLHPDLKITVIGSTGIKTKTFCFSAAENGGRIKFCHYQDAFSRPFVFLDGHAIVEPRAESSRLPANFAVMLQLPQQAGVDADWMSSIILDKYYGLSGGRPIVQPYEDFRTGQANSLSWKDIKAKLPFRPSVDDLVADSLHTLFEPALRAEICSTFERVVTCCSSQETRLAETLRATIVLGPEMEFFWNTVAVSKECETPLPGLYVVGDAAGLAQGNLQAMMMGIAAADSIREREQFADPAPKALAISD
jgi:uncharacterized FAD-dependent dehydrogenase